MVLKGLLNSGDPDALAAAIAERQFLAQVEHPLIVEIYNFVTHEGAGYIVMEYVGGTSLKQLLKERMRAARAAYDPLPVDQAIAYILEVLPAFQYLHDLGLRVLRLQAGQPHPGGRRRQADRPRRRAPDRRPRLRDLRHGRLPGARGRRTSGRPCRPTSTRSGARWPCSPWSSAATRAPTSSSLPPVDETPLFPEHDSLYRLLLKACAPDPADRFVSADELRVQLLGVLREVVAADAAGRRRPSTRRRPCSSTTPPSPTTRSTGRTCRRCGPTTATRRCRGCAP